MRLDVAVWGAVVGTILGCGSAADDRATTVAAAQSSSTSTGGASGEGGASGTSTSTATGGAGGAECPMPAPTSGDAAVTDCSEVGATSCFSSYECASDARCENVGTSDSPVPCCMPGPRGEGKAGAPCAGEFQCASSLCIEGIGPCFGSCTDRCASNDECPSSMPNCVLIGFSGTDDKFCSP